MKRRRIPKKLCTQQSNMFADSNVARSTDPRYYSCNMLPANDQADEISYHTHHGPNHDILPPELIEIILSDVDDVYLPVCIHVCKLWHRLICNNDKEDPLSIKKDKFCSALARLGHLELLSWARNQAGCIDVTSKIILHAAAGGHLPLVKYFLAKSAEPHTFKKGNGFCAQAAAGGHLHVLKYLRDLGFDWFSDTASKAAAGGHFELLQWARQNGCKWNARVCEAAARGGHFEILKWAYQNKCPWSAATCMALASRGELGMLQWARKEGCPWDGRTCSYAAAGGHLDVLKWARERGASWDERTCARAAEGGHLAVLRWARQRGCRWEEHTCRGAALYGHLEVLQWARANGCQWDRFMCAAAALGCHFSILKWAHENGCPWDEATCSHAVGSGYVRNQWGLQHRYKWSLCPGEGAASDQRLEILKWARANGCPWDEVTTRAAVEGKHWDILRWAVSNGCPWNAEYALRQAAKLRNSSVKEWIEQLSPSAKRRNVTIY